MISNSKIPKEIGESTPVEMSISSSTKQESAPIREGSFKRKPTKLDQCIKKRGLLAGQITLRKGIKNRVKKQGTSNVDLLGLEEWQ